MTDSFPAHKPPQHRLLRFLIPVLLAHGLLLATLPYWLDHPPAVQPGMTVELLPITADTVSNRPAAEPAPEPTAASVPVAALEPKMPPTPPTTAITPTVPLAPAPQPPVKPVPSSTNEAAQTTDVHATTAAHAPTVTENTATASAHNDDPSWRDDYLTSLRTALARLHHYPARAHRFGLSGEVLVAITISRNGQFSDIRLIRSSDAELLDQAALDTVRRLGHFLPLPADYSEDSWVVSVPLVYRLN